MAGLNTEYLEEGLWSIRGKAFNEDYPTIIEIVDDLLKHMNEALE